MDFSDNFFQALFDFIIQVLFGEVLLRPITQITSQFSSGFEILNDPIANLLRNVFGKFLDAVA